MSCSWKSLLLVEKAQLQSLIVVEDYKKWEDFIDAALEVIKSKIVS